MTDSKQFSVLGNRLPRNDALEKVIGTIRFSADLNLPGMLHARFLRSPYAHARITKIDTSRAEALPGVKGVLTYENVPRVHPRQKLDYLMDSEIRCAGQEVAMVAAVSKEVADEALKLIEVQYEVLPAVFDAEEAMQPGAPLVYAEYGTNIYHGTDIRPVPRCSQDGWLRLEAGDIDQGFADADFIVESTYETPIQHNCSPLPRSVVCQWTGDKLTCWADTQVTTTVWRDMAACLGMPQSNVRLISAPAVGAYGAKEPEATATLTAIMARRTGRPVKAFFTREEDFIATHRRLNYKTIEKIGVKKDGTISAMHHRMITNFGKDCANPFSIPAASAAGTCAMLYPCPNLKWEGCTVITNIEQHGAMNGFGDAEAGFCLERAIDEVSEKIEMDPVEFRLKNCLHYGTRALAFRAVLGLTPTGAVATGMPEWGVAGPDLDSLPECIRIVAEKSGWKQKWQGWRTPVKVQGTQKTGIGVAIGMHHSGYHPSSATVQMNSDGTVSVLSSFVEMGSGCGTAMAQVVAEALGLAYRDVSVVLSDTAVTPPGFGNVGSSGTSSGIAAAKHAADVVRGRLFELAAARLGAEPEDLEARDRRISVKGQPDRNIPIAYLCAAAYQITGTAVNPPLDKIIDPKTGKVVQAYAVAATVAEVEVDTETGELSVLKLTSAHDCGRAINPMIVENQIDLSLTIANGWVRTEQFIIDPATGAMLNPTLLDYKVMSILDMPSGKDIQKSLVEMPCPWGPYGAKGMSETAVTTPAPAIANAVYNAIGVRTRGGHLTPADILEALGEVKNAKGRKKR